jgi:hypothetical protein
MSEAILPDKTISLVGCDGYESYKIDGSTIGIRPKWISVKDRLPEFDIHVLAHDTQRSYICFRREEIEYNEHWGICEDCDCSCQGCTGAITHWMPLPDPPT